MFHIISVLVGITFFLFTLIRVFHIWHSITIKNIKTWWSVLVGLVLFFLVSYIIYLFSIASQINIISLDLLVSQVFLWGAIFVFLIFSLFETTLQEMFGNNQKLEKALKGAAESAEYKVKAAFAQTNFLEAAEYKKTFDAITDLIFIQDTDFTIIKVNKAFADYLKMKPEEIIGKKCYQVLHKLDSPWPNCPFEQTLKDHKAHIEEVDDPNIGVPLLITTSPIFDEKGIFVGSVHLAKNLTEIKQKEKQIQTQNKELLSRNEELKKQHSFLMDREKRIVEMKQEINSLLKHAGKTKKYL
ncbi:PAS domain-containing protein [bacterium]|jgi:PAS domain S-box-containing protein|nr:PAS domain-containing protein [bacterium]MBT3580939.1 PAS domain-containing protein [bacterium]MBT4552022.1 PAS domain-containing protein [bacterium]MBT5988250.1 PAS domain-containing protein [bacterium]MBT7088592.1 PAS domain-containing protein [bacterium]